jgi:uncharacterized membrane protein YgcG
MAKKGNNILKWLLLLAGVGVGIYAVKKSKDTNAQTTPTSAAISTDIYQAVDDFVDAINNQVAVNQKIQILNKLQTRQEVEQFKNVCKEVYALTFNDLLTYLDDAELAELTEALLNKNPQMYLFEGYENKPRVTVSVYTSPSVPDIDDSTYTGRSGSSGSSGSSNTTTASTSSNRTGSSSGGRTATSSSRSTNSVKSKLLNEDQLKILMM